MRFYKQSIVAAFLLLLVQFSLCQSNRSDTVFLKKQGSGDNRQLVYILRSNSPNHLAIFKNMIVDTLRYQEVFNELEDSLHSEKKLVVHSPAAGEWVSIHNYNGKLYAYQPSEPYTNLYLNVTDSSVDVNDFSDGIIPFLILEIDSSQKDKLAYNLKGLYDYGSRITFHFLNPQKDMAVVEFPNHLAKNRYHLVAEKNRILQMLIIVNESHSGRVEEWKFDAINYQVILDGRKKLK